MRHLLLCPPNLWKKGISIFSIQYNIFVLVIINVKLFILNFKIEKSFRKLIKQLIYQVKIMFPIDNTRVVLLNLMQPSLFKEENLDVVESECIFIIFRLINILDFSLVSSSVLEFCINIRT